VWFPIDADGEPHVRNPTDGCGGGLHQLETRHQIEYTRDGATPHPDGSNVLEGAEFRATTKCLVLGDGWQETTDLVYRDFRKPREQGGCSGEWSTLESRLLAIEEPCWATIGQLWGMLHGKTPRLEERALCVCTCPDDADDHEPCCTCVCTECMEAGEDSEPHVCTAGKPKNRASHITDHRHGSTAKEQCVCSCPAEADDHEPHCQCECSECMEHEACAHT